MYQGNIDFKTCAQMKIIAKKTRHDKITLQVENLDDLWILYNLIQPGDRIDGKTTRRIIVTDHEDDKGERRVIHLKIVVEDIEFHEFANRLRAKGKIIEGPEDLISLKSYHTFNIEAGTVITIEKDEWRSNEWKLLDDAEKRKTTQKLLVVAIDSGEANFGEIGDYYQKTSVNVSEHIPGKRYGDVKDSDEARNMFFADVLRIIVSMKTATPYTKIVIAGPGFTREHFMDYCIKKDPTLKPLIMSEAVSTATVSGIHELVRKQAIQLLLKDSRIIEETKLVDEVMARLGKGTQDIVYGIEEIRKAADIGAIQDLLITDEIMRKVNAQKDQAMFELLKGIEANRGKITVISTLHDAGKTIKGLGGMVALLRFKLGY